MDCREKETTPFTGYHGVGKFFFIPKMDTVRHIVFYNLKMPVGYFVNGLDAQIFKR
jgi:hypothetical protein